jgi:S-adenosylmethionine synthetase
VFDQDGFSWKEQTKIETHLHSQSADIAMGVDASGNKDEGAGDQGIMFGYATDETEDLMPAPIQYSHAMLRRLAEVRKNGTEPSLGPDAKSQLSVKYHGGIPTSVTSIVLSTQHLDEKMSSKDVRSVVEPYIREVLPDNWITNETKWHVNPTGKFVIGGPVGDCGLTGRKIIVDTYGGMARHGGGAFSAKDPSKVDRSAAYAARYVAKNIVASGLADYCEIQVSSAIGIAKPTSINVNTFNSEKVSKDLIQKTVEEKFDLRPKSIINMLDLKKPIYLPTAAYGHFGRTDIDLSWERTDKASDIAQ